MYQANIDVDIGHSKRIIRHFGFVAIAVSSYSVNRHPKQICLFSISHAKWDRNEGTYKNVNLLLI